MYGLQTGIGSVPGSGVHVQWRCDRRGSRSLCASRCSIDPWARSILEQLASYAEFSPNDGIHIFLRGAIPAGMLRRVAHAPHKEAAVEMYSQGRYFTITGRQVPGTPDQLATVGEDTSLLVEALVAKNGEQFRALWQGDTTGYLCASEADQELCNLLTFWTGNNPARVDRLFRASGLYRADKWQRAVRASETYGTETVARLCNQPGVGQTDAIGQPDAPTRHRARSRSAAIPFPLREVPDGTLPEREQHPLPETPIDQVLACLRREEAGDAQLFTHLFRGRYLYDHTERVWYAWQGHAWKRDETNQVVNMVSGPLAAVYLETSAELSSQTAEEARALPPSAEHLTEEEYGDTARARKHLSWLKATTASLIQRARDLCKLHRIQNVLALASTQGPLSITSDKWDTNPWLLGTPDGVIDLHTGQMHPGQPEDYIKTVIPTQWHGIGATAPRFERFWHEIFGDRPEGERADLIAFMQRALGYGITGRVTEHIFLMLYGPGGRNGKDTLMETLQHVLGPTSGAVSNDVVIAGSRVASTGSATPHLVDLQGKRIAWASEPQQGARFDVGQVKYLTGGGAISARQLHGRQYTFAPSHLLLLLTNHKPHADGGDSAFWHRLCPIIFNLTFIEKPTQPNERKRDTGMLSALKAEASGVLAWLVRGCLEWQRQGLAIPECVLHARREYQGEEDTLADFFKECCVLAPHAKVRAGKLYERYKDWTSENNVRAFNGRTFGMEMKKRFAWLRDMHSSYYQGIGIFENAEDSGLCEAQPHGRTMQGAASIAEADHPASQDVVEAFQEPDLTRHDQEPQRQSAMQVQEFSFPRERIYVRTSLGIVGYLTHNDTSGCRAVRDLLGDPASEVFTSAPLQYLTWEEARVWWLEHTS